MIAFILMMLLVLTPQQSAANQISDAQKKDFLNLLKTLPHEGEFFTDDAIKTAGPYLPVLFALTDKDIDGYDIYPFAALSRGVWGDLRGQTPLFCSLTESGVTVSLEFRFNTAGEVTGIYTPARWGSFDGGYRQAAWEGHFRTYEDRGGIVVPSEGEVGWYSEGKWLPVWKGRMIEAGADLRGHGQI